jgi:hypothetical protein
LAHIQGSQHNLEYGDGDKSVAQGFAHLNGIHTDPKERADWLPS